MASKLDIPLHGSSVNIVRRCGSNLSHVIQTKFGCVATFDGVDFESGLSSAPQRKPVPEKRFATTLDSGVQVSVWKADLTSFPVDAVVNAANMQLQHYGGLALALSNAGGPQIQKESDDYIKKYGRLKTGDAIVSDAGLLPCNKIIHAVGPCLPKYPSKYDVSYAKVELERAITSILEKVKDSRLQSVAIPAISSGLFNYPLPECANTIVTTVRDYYRNSSGHLPKEVLLVNHDEPTVKEMEAACHKILTPHQPMTYSQAAAGKSKGDSKTSKPTVQIGNIHLTLKKGKIEEQQTDVIVNTIFDRDLSRGQISNAMLQKAGYEMQREMNVAHLSGSFIITKPYKLQCKEVYHISCAGVVKDDAPKSLQILFEVVSECLWKAVSSNHKSIAFPAIGTGGLGFNKKEAAQIMTEAVAKFSKNSSGKIDVYFVIFPSDYEIFKAFEEQMWYLQQTASSPSFTHAPEHREDLHSNRAATPQISLSGLAHEMTREAERWLTGLLFKSSGTVIIRNNFIQHFGEQEHLQLSRLNKKDVSIEEYFVKGHASIVIRGDSNEDVVVAGLQVEAILCDIQREFVREEEAALLPVISKNVSFERKPVHHSSLEFKDRLFPFKRQELRILTVDRVENPALKVLFDLKKNQICCYSPRKMFQRIPAQFCEMVSHVGFHAEYAPPDDPAYGEGIYFAGTVKKAMEVWKQPEEEYLYFVEAEVLTGKSTPGKPGLILPPAVGTQMYDSVSGDSDISVIFSGYQALPTYIITCKMV